MTKSDQRPDITPRHASLDLKGSGYWVAGAIDDTRREKLKSYFDAKVHGQCRGWELLDEIREVNAIDNPKISELIDLARRQEEDTDPDLVGSVVQTRWAQSQGQVPEAKIYFRPVRRPGIGIRRAASRIETLVRERLGEGAAKGLRREILRRDAVYPTFYISIALRPDLEVETYHDVEANEESAWAPWEVESLSRKLTGRDVVGSRAGEIAQVARRHGFRCHHVSCDLLAGSEAISLFFDHDARVHGKEREYRAALADVCSLAGSRTQMPIGEGAFRLSSHLHPIMIATKISNSKDASFSVLIEEIDADLASIH